MNKIDQDAQYHFNSIIDDGGIGNDKDAEREASWRALRDQMPKRSRADYNKERAHVTDKRSAAKLYVKGNNFKNESKNMNNKLIRLTESDVHKIVKESVNKILNEIGDTPKGQRALGALAAARFKGKKKGDWGEPSKKADVEAIKAAEKYGHEQNNANEPWSGWKSYHKKQAELGHAYNDGYQSQMKESVVNEVSSFDSIRNGGWQDRIDQIAQLAKECLELAKNESPNGFGSRELYSTARDILRICQRWGSGI